MKPNFALDLSPDGIGLLHRGVEGWHTVGHVSLDDPEFSDKLGYLRQTATALENSGVTTKLIIPNSQILFTIVDAAGPTEAERREQIRNALVGATPYEIDELEFDWTVNNGIVQVAAVAKETLAEAESFANEHRFNPVSFVANPLDGQFLGVEPYFGTTEAANTLLDPANPLERDKNAIRILGPIREPIEQPINEPVIEPVQEPTPVLVSEPEQEPAPAPTPAAPEPKIEIEDKPAITAEPDQEVEPEPATEPAPVTDPIIESTSVTPAAPLDDTGQEQAISFKSKNPTIPEAAEAPITASITAPELPKLDEEIPEVPLPSFASKRTGSTEADDRKALDRIEKTESRLAILPEGTTSKAPKLGGVSRKVIDDKPALETPASPPPQPQAPPPTPAPVPPQTPVASPVSEAPMIEAPEAVPPAAIPDPQIAAQPAPLPHTDTEEQAMTVFGARKKPAQRGKPRHLGLVLMLVLLAVLGAIVLWSSFFLSDKTAFWRKSPDTIASPVQPQLASTPPEPEAEDSNQTVNDALAMLTEPSILRTPQPQAVTTPAAIDPATSQSDEITAPPALADAPKPLSQEDAQTAYLENGIWQRAPKAPNPLVEDNIETLYITSADPTIATQDAIALPSFADTSGDSPLVVQSSPAAHSTAFVLDDRGLVIPSIDGTMTPDGVLVFAGPPPVKPKARGNLVPQVLAEPDLRLATFRPIARPSDLVQQTETAHETEQLGGYTRQQLAALRPKPRPYVVSPPQNETPPEVDHAAVAEAVAEAATTEPEGPVSAQAVVLSSAPKHRPRNFAKLVERSRASAPSERATAATAVPRNQTAAPSGPTRASVARLATTKNAINLRRTSLIGVYGSPNKRRALVRLSNGRYVKVKVGQRVDGGKVAAIGQSELRYIKGGRTIILRMPKS